MDFSQLVVLGTTILSKLRLPSGKPPPEPDVVEIYKQCRKKIDTDSDIVQTISPPVGSAFILSAPSAAELPSEPSQNISTACVPCLRGHLSAVSGALSEAERMSRGEGIANAEVADRIRLAQDEITIAERKDLTPEAILKAPAAEKLIIDEFLPRIRELRQHITTIFTREDLMHVAAEANIMGRDLTLRHLESRGIDAQKVVDIASQVSNGKITLDDAKKRVEELVKA